MALTINITKALITHLKDEYGFLRKSQTIRAVQYILFLCLSGIPREEKAPSDIVYDSLCLSKKMDGSIFV
jgi:hypothetical protein